MTTNTEILFAGPRKEAEDVCMPCLVNYVYSKENIERALCFLSGLMAVYLRCCFINVILLLSCSRYCVIENRRRRGN